MTGGLIILGAIAFAVMCYACDRRANSAEVEGGIVTAKQVMQGVKNEWYSCTLLDLNGKPAVRLTGKDKDGEEYSGVFPISQADWYLLRNEGYEVEA